MAETDTPRGRLAAKANVEIEGWASVECWVNKRDVRVVLFDLAQMEAKVAKLEADALGAWLPIVLCPTDGVWRLVRLPDGAEVVASFEGEGLGPMARQWRTKTLAYHTPSRPSGTVYGGVEQMTEPYDTFVIRPMPEGVYPTHFRPNDTVFRAARASRGEGETP